MRFLRRLQDRRRQTEAPALTTSTYEAFQARYYLRPDLFVRECVRWPAGQTPTGYQEEIGPLLVRERRVSLRSPHGAGKTAIAAILTLWFALTRDGRDWKIATTASAWRQLTKFLWPEIHKWARLLNWGVIGRPPFNERTELFQLSLRLKTGEAFAMASDQESAIEGAHADHILFLFDEAKAIPDKTWDAAEGALSTASKADDPHVREALAMCISTPGVPQGRFYEIQTRKMGFEDWAVRHVTRAEAIAAGRMSAEWADARLRQWGEHSSLYRNRVLGEFSESDPEAIIPLEYVEAANERWEEWRDAGCPGRLTEIGVDVGGGGEEADRSVFAYIYDHRVVAKLEELPHGSQQTAIVQCANKVAAELHGPEQLAFVDATGIGAGTLQRLIELGGNAWGFVSQRRTYLTNETGDFGFANWRAAGWWLMREALSPHSPVKLCLPPDEDLTYELTAPHYEMTGQGVQVESKKQLRKRIGRSTDHADAVIYPLVGPLLVQEALERLLEEPVVHDHEPVGGW